MIPIEFIYQEGNNKSIEKNFSVILLGFTLTLVYMMIKQT